MCIPRRDDLVISHQRGIRTHTHIYRRHPVDQSCSPSSSRIQMVYQGRFRSSSTLSICIVIMMVALAIVPTAAVRVYLVNNKDEALKICDGIKGSKYGNYPLYRDGPQGKDIFYSCGYQKERPSTLNRSESCASKPSGWREDAPVSNVYYTCGSDGRLTLNQCYYKACQKVTDYNKQ